MIYCIRRGMEPEASDSDLGMIAATRAVRRRIQAFKANHGFKSANDVIEHLLDLFEKGGD